jgi:membrane-bound serine protease (ClpP class)
MQIPGWLLVAAMLLLLRSTADVASPVVGAVIGLAVLKDLALYPFLRHSYRGDPRTGGERLVGSRGSVTMALTPHGYIFVRGERWQAKTETTEKTVAEGTSVRVRGASGLMLIVEPD